MNKEKEIEQNYDRAKEKYSEIGVNTDKVINRIDSIPISVHCWQGDDVQGFEDTGQALTGGIQATGNYRGKARSIDELRLDMVKAFEHIPGEKKCNLHAIYLDSHKKVARDEIEPEHFESWVQWARQQNVGLDFNPTCFSHPLSEDGLTLSHPTNTIRDFWIRHIVQSRKINAYFGKSLNKTAILNVWVPDGYKDTPIDRMGPRERLRHALDECLQQSYDPKYHLDALESKLFGIGSESYVVGSHEFYMSYAIKHNLTLCLDAGHFHPTETVSNKLSTMALFLDNILLHVSRPVRWDSDHVVILDEELLAIAQEIMRHSLELKIHVGLDFFDASINRVAAWIIGARNMRKALLIAGLEPTEELIEAEQAFNFTKRLVYLEELKGYPWNAVWDYYCYSKGYKNGVAWFEDIRLYEKNILEQRN